MNVSRNTPCPCGATKPNGDPIKYKNCCLAKDEAQRKPHTGEDGVIICMPTRGQISYESQVAIEQNMGGVKYALVRVARKPVVEARNILAREALRLSNENPFPFTPRAFWVFWMDDDCWFPPGLPAMMLRCMREYPHIDALFAKFGRRMPGSPVLAYRKADDENSFPKVGIDCAPADVVEIERAGFHCVMMKMSLLERVGPNPFDVPANSRIGEDSAFCKRAKDVGARLFVGMQLPAFHIDPRDGTAYEPGMPAMMMEGNGARVLSLEHSVGGIHKDVERRQYGLACEPTTDAEQETAALLRAEVEQRRKITGAFA